VANAKLKTQETGVSVEKFLGALDESRRADCVALVKILQRATKAKPKMWGTSIVGFGDYHYKYESGRENDWFMAGFSPRKKELVLYLMAGVEREPALMKNLGKHKAGKGCLYIKQLSDVDTKVLEEIVVRAARSLKAAKRS
jgi:Domain of unknown function (DU1801)